MLSFCALSLLGGLLLMAPFSNADAEWRNFVDSFFMSVSSVCVTGLGVVDLGQDYTLLGQAIVLILMQVGGLSYMTITTILVYAIGKKISVGDSKIFDMSNNSDQKINFADFVIRIALLTLSIEAIGVLCLFGDSFIKYAAEIGPALPLWSQIGHAAFQALFHAVSAFCNAGLSLYSDSVASFRSNYWVQFCFTFLPVLGGLGYTVLNELLMKFDAWRKHDDRDGACFRWNLSLHTKVSLTVTFALLFIGIATQLALIYIQKLPSYDHGFLDNFWVATFQSIASRSSGFNTVDLPTLGDPSLMFLIAWMFIGACPGGTGGGIKVTTLAVVWVLMWAGLRGSKDVKLWNRSVNIEYQRRSVVVFISTVVGILLFTFMINIFEASTGQRFIDHLFEVTSAFTTVGLSTGITGDLSDPSLLVLCACMIIGRPGPLLFLMALVCENEGSEPQYPEEGVLIG